MFDFRFVQIIIAFIIVIFVLACASLLIAEQFSIKYKREKHDRDAIRMQTENIIHDNFRIAFEEEYQRRKDLEFRLKITQKELKRARDLLSKVKLSEVEK